MLICRTHHGFVCANAGVDTSNAPEDGALVLLPRDPDASARALRAALPRPPGRRHRRLVRPRLAPRAVRRGHRHRRPRRRSTTGAGAATPRGLELRATAIAIADEAAAAADLVRDKDSREPAVLVRGLARHVTDDDGPGAAALLRPVDEDLFG